MYEFTALYLYKAIFTFELLVAEFICSRGLHRRGRFWLRITGAAMFCLGIAFAIPVPVYNAWYLSAVFLIMFAVSLLGMRFCYNEKFTMVLFRAIAGYTMQHIAFQFYDILSMGVSALFNGGAGSSGIYGDSSAVDGSQALLVNLFAHPERLIPWRRDFELSYVFTLMSYLAVYPIVYCLCAAFFQSKLKNSDKFEFKITVTFVFIVLFVLSNIVMSAFVTYYSEQNFDTFYVVYLTVYNIAAAFFTLYFMIEVVYRKQLERNYAAADKRLQQSGEQYKLSKRNVELINMKCHDLKHQIHSMVDGAVDKNTLEEIDKVIAIYDSEIDTGNDALDTIFTEKSLYCVKHDIKLYCIVDGKLLHFMSDADLYSLFGNILDNAIEAVCLLDKKRRLIDLSVSEVNGFVRIKESNRYDGTLKFEGGLPKSTKGNDAIHGYGMKSIKYVCKKYRADMKVSAENGRFDLAIVFYGD